MSDFGEVRSLLHDVAPSKDAFARLLRLFRGAPDVGEARRVWMPYAVEHLKAWPMATRAMTLSGESSLEGGDATWLPMVCALTLDRQEWSPAKLWELVTSPRFEHVRAFTLEQHVAPPLALHWFAQSPYTRNLEELSLKSVRGEGGVEALAGSGLALRKLEVHGGGAVGDAGVVALVNSPMIETLRVLTLWSCGVGNEGVRALASAREAKLRALNLSYNMAIDESAVRALADGPHASSFESLQLDECGVGDGLVALVESGRLDACEILDLRTSGIGDDGVIALAGSGAVETMRELRIMDGRVGRAGAFALAGATWPALTMLQLEGNPLGAAGVIALARAEGMNALTKLDMDRCALDALTLDGEPIEPEEFAPDRTSEGALEELLVAESGLDARAARALARTARLAGLLELTLHHNPMGAEGARALAESPYLGALTSIDLEGCGLGDEGLAALFPDGEPLLPSLQKLDLCGNGFTDASAPVLANLGGMRLRELRLEDNLFGAPWIEALVDAPWSGGLELLTLSNIPLGVDGLEALGRAQHLDSLRFLDVSHTGVTSRGLRALVTAPLMRGLETLFATLDDCEGEVMLALAASPHVTSLEAIWLGHHAWEDEVWRALATSPNLVKLRLLDVHPSLVVEDVFAEELAAGVRLNPWVEREVSQSRGAM